MDFKCEFCGSTMSPSWQVKDATGHPWNYVRCNPCAWTRLAVEASDSTWQELAYAENYYGEGFSKFSGAVQALREFSAWRRAREIHHHFPKPGRVLDIGCGEGLFLRSMKSLGWSTHGCEIGASAAARAEKNLGHPIHRGTFETMKTPEHPWDVVMLWHVLEHLPHPAEFLKSISKVMSKDGLLVIAIPNADSWQAQYFKEHWFHLDPPRHFYNLGLHHLKQIASRAGWEAIETHHFSLEYNPFGWMQSFLNALGYKRDAFYEALKHRKSILHAEFTLVRIAAWLLLAPSIIPSIFEAAAKKGGCTCTYFRRSPT